MTVSKYVLWLTMSDENDECMVSVEMNIDNHSDSALCGEVGRRMMAGEVGRRSAMSEASCPAGSKHEGKRYRS
jgi:hypothetical protein